MKHLLLATLLVSPLALHAQLIGLSSSYSISVVGHESDPSAYQPPSLSLSGTGDGSYSSSDINTTGWELTGAQAAFSAGIGNPQYVPITFNAIAGTATGNGSSGPGYTPRADSMAQVDFTFTFSVTSPVAAVFKFNARNTGPSEYFGAGYHNISDSHFEFSLSSSTGGSLYSHNQSAPVYILTDSLDLGVLQPNAVYTFTASAHADARTFTSDSYGHTEALVDFAGGIDVTPVPEPGTYAFATGAGLLGFVFWRQAKARRLSPNN